MPERGIYLYMYIIYLFFIKTGLKDRPENRNSNKNKLIASMSRYPKNPQRSCLFCVRAVVNPFRRY